VRQMPSGVTGTHEPHESREPTIPPPLAH
jgi:hypothetical protein